MFLKNGKRKIIFGCILLIILSITIGYALYSQQLVINGNTVIKENTWSIYFDNIRKQEGSIDALDADNEARIVNSKKTQIRFGINFKKPGDKYEFVVDIVNDGTIDAMLDTVTISGFEDLSDVFTYDVTYLDGTPFKKCDLLKANTRTPIRVIANYGDVSDKSQLPTQTKTVNLTFDAKYIQKDNNCVVDDGNTVNP